MNMLLYSYWAAGAHSSQVMLPSSAICNNSVSSLLETTNWLSQWSTCGPNVLWPSAKFSMPPSCSSIAFRMSSNWPYLLRISSCGWKTCTWKKEMKAPGGLSGEDPSLEGHPTEALPPIEKNTVYIISTRSPSSDPLSSPVVDPTTPGLPSRITEVTPRLDLGRFYTKVTMTLSNQISAAVTFTS